jgi:plasmid stability protein
MASITIRNLELSLKSRLRVRAAQNGRSMEEEARAVLREVLSQEESRPANLLDVISRRFQQVGPIELTIPPREPMRDPPDLDR